MKNNDYYAFGMEMPGRSVNQDYTYGFNGKLDDSGDSWQIQDYGFRNYDYRLGRFLSTDPLTASYAYLSPYQFASNRPIDGVDLDGKEWSVSSKMGKGKNNKPKVIITFKVKAEFHNIGGLPKNFVRMAELYVESLYKAEYTTSDGTEVEIETVADFSTISTSEKKGIKIGVGGESLLPSEAGQTMDMNGGKDFNSQDAYITLFTKVKRWNIKTMPSAGYSVKNQSTFDLLVTIAHELGHTVGLEHDGNGLVFEIDQMLSDEHNLMNWLDANDTKGHLETHQIINIFINILKDLQNEKYKKENPDNDTGTHEDPRTLEPVLNSAK